MTVTGLDGNITWDSDCLVLNPGSATCQEKQIWSIYNISLGHGLFSYKIRFEILLLIDAAFRTMSGT
jgi:hypothetical protein